MGTAAKPWQAVLVASAVGLATITIYVVVAGALMSGNSVAFMTERLLQWDASNAFGTAAFSGGWVLATVGLLMDAVVSTCWATAFVLLFLNVAFVRRYTLVSGLLFGAIVMFVMLYLVVPIGHAVQPPRTAVSIINNLIAHTVFFGLPIAATVRQLLVPRPIRAAL